MEPMRAPGAIDALCPGSVCSAAPESDTDSPVTAETSASNKNIRDFISIFEAKRTENELKGHTQNTKYARLVCGRINTMERAPAPPLALDALCPNSVCSVAPGGDTGSPVTAGYEKSTLETLAAKNKIREFISIFEAKRTENELKGCAAAVSKKKTAPAARDCPEDPPSCQKRQNESVKDNLITDKVIIFTYTRFENGIAENRPGVDVDTINLESVFTHHIGYCVRTYRNHNIEQTVETCIRLKNVLHSQMKCVFIVVSSHGCERPGPHGTDIRCSDGKLISVLDIISYFNNDHMPQLRDVPKVFIFQICRGPNHTNKDSELKKPDLTWSRATDQNGNPVYTNMLLAFSSQPGCESYRDQFEGTWYVQEVYKMFRQHAHEYDVKELLERAGHNVKTRSNNRQIPALYNLGFKRVYLPPARRRYPAYRSQ